jgi:hypothetical protein
MFRRISHLILMAVLTAITALLVISCGGDDGGAPAARVLQPVAYTGNTSPVAISLTNTPVLVTNVLFGGSAASEIPGAVMITETGVPADERPTGGDELMDVFHNSMDSILDDTLHGYQLPAAKVINDTEYCENVSGYYTVRGTVDDFTDSGTLTFDYYNCLMDGITYDGMYHAHIHEIDLFLFTYRFNVTMEVVLMNLIGPDFNVSMSGTILFDDAMSGYSMIERSTMNYTEKHNNSNRMYKYEKYVMTAVIDDFYSYYSGGTSSGSISLTGAPVALLYDSNHGSVTVDTNTALRYSSTSRLYPDLGGQLVFTGELSAIRLTVESGRHVQLELDLDRDPDYEVVRYVLWSELDNATTLNLADSDLDGMHDSWESTYGLDPNVDDAAEDDDEDGLSNLEEYQQGYDPGNPLSPVP